MALVKRVVGHFRANLVVTLCVLQTGGGLEPQANGETPQVAVVVRPGMLACGAKFLQGKGV